MLTAIGPRTSALDGAGLPAGSYYEPYPARLAPNLKELLAAGITLIVRLHPGLRYPMSDEDLHGRVDPEGCARQVFETS
ncbi:MAG TPA: hypothetical protein VMV52_02950 [Candidatus Nanopelagicaceae bacterium]|nr:hypothetical protein [Candidatus Nanopelagicaceae bacterium]